MDKEALHEAFAKVVDASFAFTMAFNEHVVITTNHP
jgi:hypothetical protein